MSPHLNRFSRYTRGFTLLEILVVIVIMAVLFGSVMLTTDLGGGDNKKGKEEAQRLIALIKLAQEEAIFQSREFGLSFWLKGYRFFVLTPEEGWLPVENDKTFRTRTLPEPLEFELTLDGIDTKLDLNLKRERDDLDTSLGSDKNDDDRDSLDTSRDADTDRYRLHTPLEKKKKPKPPQIFILSSGETSTFDITFTNKDDYSYSFSVDALGKITREDDEEDENDF